MSGSVWHLFERFGVELEYMIAGESLDVLPVADELFKAVAGDYVSDVCRGATSWSNELVAHLVELKTNGPTMDLESLPVLFDRDVADLNRLLRPLGGRLLPSAMHPWMDPWSETRLWPHDSSEIYQAYHRIFDCRGHGWSNLQSVHLNLPFANDDEFGRLHAAVRLLLPILPALAASSPVADGRPTGLMDTRLAHYRANSRRIPSVTGKVIPERAFSRRDYESLILDPMYAAIAPLDPEGLLRDEFLNSRGAIARFGRSTIEIRLLDVQECPRADLAICAAVVGALEALVDERWAPLAVQQSWEIEPLERILVATIRDAEQAVIDNPAYPEVFGYRPTGPCTAHDLWRHLIEAVEHHAAWEQPLRLHLEQGPLARRITRALAATDWSDPVASRHRLKMTYQQLADCLATGMLFVGDGA